MKTLIIINVIVFVLEKLFLDRLTFGDMLIGYIFKIYFYLWPVFETNNFQIWQLLSYQFIHGDLWHIFFNLFALWMFGSELENEWGSRKFLIYYLLSGIGAGLIQLFVAPLFGTAAPTIGASGAVFGILVAFGLSYPNRPIFMFPIFIPVPAKIFVMIYAGINLLMGISGTGGNVAYFAHLGGALTGFLLFKFGDRIGLYRFFDRIFSGRRRPLNYYEEEPRRVYQPFPGEGSSVYRRQKSQEDFVSSIFSVNGEEITQAKIDEILDKISETGYQNLTDREKAILFELSKKIK
jgi:membrane associated rhomboid family serine protease